MTAVQALTHCAWDLVPLDPAGPSPWWCDAACQAAWQGAAGADPEPLAAAIAAQVLADTKPDTAAVPVPPVLEADYDDHLDAVDALARYEPLRATNPAIATPEQAATERAHAAQLAAARRRRVRRALAVAVGALATATAVFLLDTNPALGFGAFLLGALAVGLIAPKETRPHLTKETQTR